MQPRITADNIEKFYCQETATLDLSEKEKNFSELTMVEVELLTPFIKEHAISTLNLSKLYMEPNVVTALFGAVNSLNTLIIHRAVFDINLICQQLADCSTLQALDLTILPAEIVNDDPENVDDDPLLLEPIRLTKASFFTLMQSKSLKHLNLTDNFPTMQSVAGIFTLVISETIEELILDANELGDEGARILAEGKFNVLSVENCGIGVLGAKALIQNKHFDSLNLGLNTDLSDQEFLNLVALNDTLIELDLSMSGINANCCTIIAKNKTLKRLILRFNEIREGLIAFKNHPSLIYLNVRTNNITESDGCDFFTDNIILQGIDLADNLVADKTAAAVGSNIKVIDISDNMLNKKGVEILLGKKHLEGLLIKNNFVTPKELRKEYKRVLSSHDPHVRWKYAEGGSSLFALAAHELTDKDKENKDKEKLEKEEQYKTISEDIKRKMVHLT